MEVCYGEEQKIVATQPPENTTYHCGRAMDFVDMKDVGKINLKRHLQYVAGLASLNKLPSVLKLCTGTTLDLHLECS